MCDDDPYRDSCFSTTFHVFQMHKVISPSFDGGTIWLHCLPNPPWFICWSSLLSLGHPLSLERDREMGVGGHGWHRGVCTPVKVHHYSFGITHNKLIFMPSFSPWFITRLNSAELSVYLLTMLGFLFFIESTYFHVLGVAVWAKQNSFN